MCLILFAWKAHPDYRLVVAANRDEFHARPADALARWDDAPHVIGGRDRAAVIGMAGTWLGLSEQGRFAALTNLRAPSEKRTDARSRGELTARFLRGEWPDDASRVNPVDRPAAPPEPESFIDTLRVRAADYNGFNLLAANTDEMWWYNNRSTRPAQALAPGIYGLSNAELDTPWPKVCHRVAAFAEALACDTGADPSPYLDLLADTRQAADFELPQTGVSAEWEKLLSSAFIRTPFYGTRASTVLRVRHDGNYDMTERRFDAEAVTGQTLISGRNAALQTTGAGRVPTGAS